MIFPILMLITLRNLSKRLASSLFVCTVARTLPILVNSAQQIENNEEYTVTTQNVILTRQYVKLR